ncbi:MAG: (d)CMP kinase [Firmicutes bacterium]|nr:(d)CMP kinase [Bacillota bacterium]
MQGLIRVAIDGPSGAGKSTIAKAVAKELGLDYIDTGAMYRACGYKMLREGIEAVSSDPLRDMLGRTDIDFSGGSVFLDGENVDDMIRTPEVTKMASACSALPEVRAKLVELQRAIGSRKNVIMDGRDIGTNVLPDAEFKIFLTATPEERAKRRYEEMIAKGMEADYDQVLADINKRDYDDSHRELDPLKKADDAEEVDTTYMSIEEVRDHILNKIKNA